MAIKMGAKTPPPVGKAWIGQFPGRPGPGYTNKPQKLFNNAFFSPPGDDGSNAAGTTNQSPNSWSMNVPHQADLSQFTPAQIKWLKDNNAILP